MNNIFNPVNINFEINTIGQYTRIFKDGHFPDWKKSDIIIIGVEKKDFTEEETENYAPNEIRKSLYSLFPGDWNIKLADLGNLKLAENNNDALIEILTEIFQHKKSVILLGNNQKLSYSIIKSLNNIEKYVNFTVVDSEIDFDIKQNSKQNMNAKNYLNYILSDSDFVLNNMSIIGTQTYYNHPEKSKVLNRLYIDEYKLGEIKNNIIEVEPEIRNAHFVSVDVSSIENTYMPAQQISRPNGFSGIEICEISRFSGLSRQNKAIGIFGMNPFYDKNFTGSHQIAQVIWYYIDGKNSSNQQKIIFDKNKMTKFHVPNEIIRFIFYKNNETEQWWVEFLDLNIENRIFPCSYNDYKLAINKILSKRLKSIIEKNKI